MMALMVLVVTIVSPPVVADIDAEVDGVERANIPNWFNKWGYGELDLFMEHVNDHECGIDTDIEVQCPHCKMIQDIELPMDSDFFSPSTRRKRSTRSI